MKRPAPPRRRRRRSLPAPLAAHHDDATGFDESARHAIRVRSRGLCEIRWSPLCLGYASDGEPHHRKLRRHGDHRPVNGLDCCPPCHRWAHDNVALARSLGVIVASWHDAANVPVTAGPYG